MRSLSIAGILALALAACEPQGLRLDDVGTPPVAATDTAGCSVHVEKDWNNEQAPLRRYTSEAQTIGSTSQQAVAVLTIRARDGSPIYTWSGQVEHLFGLKDAPDVTAMKSALEEWITQSGMSATTAGLPRWAETEGQQQRAEFPFMPESWIDEETWNTLRAQQLDLFCFPQGSESMRCAVLRDGRVEEIGLQLFPG
jgi:hypothetical protein